MRDATVFNVALAAAKQLDLAFFNKELIKEGDWVRVRLAENHRYVYVAHQRYRDPKIALLSYAYLV